MLVNLMARAVVRAAPDGPDAAVTLTEMHPGPGELWLPGAAECCKPANCASWRRACPPDVRRAADLPSERSGPPPVSRQAGPSALLRNSAVSLSLGVPR